MLFSSTRDLRSMVDALNKSQAVIEFNMDGTIITANQNFLDALGYGLDEIRGKHHRMFVTETERNGAAYTEFWESLNRGTYKVAEYKRVVEFDRATGRSAPRRSGWRATRSTRCCCTSTTWTRSTTR